MQINTGRKRACVGGWVHVSLLSFALCFFLCVFCMFVCGFFFCISLLFFFLLAYVNLVELSVKKTRRSACDALPLCTTYAHEHVLVFFFFFLVSPSLFSSSEKNAVSYVSFFFSRIPCLISSAVIDTSFFFLFICFHCLWFTNEALVSLSFFFL